MPSPSRRRSSVHVLATDDDPLSSSGPQDGGSAPRMSLNAMRRDNALPLCMSRSQQEALAQAYLAAPSSPTAGATGGSPRGPRAARRRASSVSVTQPSCVCVVPIDGLPGVVDRGIQMMTTYPLMRVAGTAFENSLRTTAHRRLSTRGSDSGPASPEQQEISPIESLVLDQYSAMLVVAGEKRPATPGRPDNMVRVAGAMKRAAMWQSLVAGALACTAMSEQFRTARIRNALERHFLPVLLQRKADTGSVINLDAAKAYREQRRGPDEDRQSGGREAGDNASAPTSAYLKEHCAFFAELGNSVLLDSLAESMERHRYAAGDLIATAGDPGQVEMFFLVSGKCEARARPNPLYDANSAAGTAGIAISTPLVLNGSRHFGSPSRRAANVSVLYAGGNFGGIFNTNATYQATYKAISHCILWVLRAADFERIFRGFADRTMIEQYVAALRAHVEEWFPRQRPIRHTIGRIPMYRLLIRPISRYLADFTPVVKVRGETLFHHGDPADNVYCLVEGSVERATRGDDGRYASGVAQILSLNSFSTLGAAGRCVLLGEEPHILPCAQRYRCTVSSRTAMLFRITGPRFVSALLDDPKLFVSLRERLAQLYTAQLRLDPTCLGFAPLLRQFPASSLQTLAQAAQPRVIGRSVAVSEPAQGMREVFLVVSGEVRDPRTYGHAPTAPLPTPPPSEDDEEEAAAAGPGGGDNARSLPRGARTGKDQSGGGKAGAVSGKPNQASGNGGKNRGASAAAQRTGPQRSIAEAPAFGGGGRRLSAFSAAPAGLAPPEEVTDWMTASFISDHAGDASPSRTVLEASLTAARTSFTALSRLAPPQKPKPAKRAVVGSATGGKKPKDKAAAAAAARTPGSLGTTAATRTGRGPESQVPMVTPDEQQDFNPLLPPRPATRFAYTLGGGWEGLLLDKWANGWGTASMVEAWSIPTAKIRAEFNALPKAQQSAVLLAARQQQKEELGLPALSSAKLPPMSAYHASSSADAAARIAVAAGAASPANPTAATTTTSSGPHSGGPTDSRRSSHVSGRSRRPGSGPRSSSTGGAVNELSVSGDASPHQEALDLAHALVLRQHQQHRRRLRGGVTGSLDSTKLDESGSPPSSPVRGGGGGGRPGDKSRRGTAATKKATPRQQQRPPSDGAASAPPPPGPTDWRRRPRATRKGPSAAAGDEDGAAMDAARSRNLLGIYSGVYRNDEMQLYSNIVRAPDAPASRAARKTQLAATGVSACSASWPGTGVTPSLPTLAAASAGHGDRWFQEVPRSRPLPGMTLAAAQSSSAAHVPPWPEFATNTALLTHTGPKHLASLQGHTDYFSATNACRTAAGDSPRGATGGAATAALVRIDIPKRHALVK